MSACHTLYCLHVPHREPDPQQIAGVWCDLAAALFGAFSDKDRESEEQSQGGEKWRGKKQKNTAKENGGGKNGRAASGHIFTPLTRRDDCCFAPSLLPFTSPNVFLIHLHVKAVEATVQISMR